MKRNATKYALTFLIILSVAAAGYWAAVSFVDNSEKATDANKTAKNQEIDVPEYDELDRIESKKARQEYFFRLLRNPVTNSIPDDIRSQELRHARQVPTRLEIQRRMKSSNPSVQVAEGFNWRLAGPPAVGGRTRAFGIDPRNPDIIIAGGVSGGIWKSTDGGENWTLRTPNVDNFSVTSLAQDPTNPDTWYYVSGEFTSGSPGAPGAPYYGTGVFRSTDNGDSWDRIPSTSDTDARFDTQFDFISRVVVNPQTGTVFIASNGLGIFRSPNGNTYDDLTLGGFGEHAFADVTVATDGTLAGVLSSDDAGQSGGNPGLFISNNDGQNWNEITPDAFPSNYARSVIDFAPSDPDILYVFTLKIGDDSNQGVSFFKIDLSDNPENAQDRANNLPNFGEPVGGINTQAGYNMTVTVKPNDPNFVTVGATNLFRSRDGFATAPSGDTQEIRNEFWIGGYDNNNDISQYPDQHADQHVQIYDPTDPNRMWVGHDGGVSVTDDVTATPVSWESQDDGYIVTQFYDASIGLEEDDPRFMGGTQDNGTPFFEFRDEQDIGDTAADISSGDGGYSFFTENFIFVSNQRTTTNNRVIRFNRNLGNFAIVQPREAQTSLFINPYFIDPNDETIMYYPATESNVSVIFRNTEIDEITNRNNSGATLGWEELSATQLPQGFIISALEVTTVPTNTLYYAGSTTSSQTPILKRLDNASSSNAEPEDISIPNAPAGAWVHDIAVNPADGNDILAVMSNYSIVGLYHSADGGESWEAVEGNLQGASDPDSPNAGPSLRSATIIPSTSGAIYILGTSTGMYATQNLNGNNTQWGRESGFNNDGNADIGFSIVENITSRFSDGDVAVGTHGRGIFVGRFQGETAVSDIPQISLDNPERPDEPNSGQASEEIFINAQNFSFSSNPSEIEVFFGDVRAEVINVSSDQKQITVIVPRATLEPDADDRTVQVSVDRPSGTDPASVTFTVLPPNENDLKQNFPNPFTVGDGGTEIPVSLSRTSTITIEIYDTYGQRVEQVLRNERYQAGTYNIPVAFSGKASGVYIYRIIAQPTGSGDTFVESKKFTFIK